MTASYKFSTPLELNRLNSRVSLGFDDFYQIFELALEQLRLNPSNGRFTREVPQGANQQSYIDKLSFDPTKQVIKPEPSPLLPTKPAFNDVVDEMNHHSEILKMIYPQTSSSTSLKFLSDQLRTFKSAKKIFSTRSHTYKSVAKEFHAACDRKSKLVVIIKSGQYIAGGFSAVELDSLTGTDFKADPEGKTFLFSVNRQKVYPLRVKEKALTCDKNAGPVFGYSGLGIQNNYADSNNWEMISEGESSFHSSSAVPGELFGRKYFKVDAYEVFQLE